jgi:hypothetical protein
MDRVRSPRARAGFFASFLRAITKAAKRLKRGRGGDAYRPEKHYMRGPGPKSKQSPAAGDSRTPNAP